ncbi:MAG: hypothetical protein AAB709_01290 [Patescibacteria group bacterium]
MQPRPEEDSDDPLEQARESLYSPTTTASERSPFHAMSERSLPHEWGGEETLPSAPSRGARHVRRASIFFATASVFFLISLAIAGYFLYFGSNSVSIDKIEISIQGPTTIAGGDIIPLSLTITNKNPVTIENATIEIDFPEGTRSAANVFSPYPRYIENLGALASGATVTRSVKAVVFGGAGQTLVLPIVFSYDIANSNAVFEKKSSYSLAVSSTPLSVSVESLTETVSGDPLTFTLTVRSNATIPLSNVILTAASPFGFSVTSSSLPLTNASFAIGTLAPGESKRVTLSGVLVGQNNEQRVFHFTVGTAKSSRDQTLGVTYMTQDTAVSIAAPFITASLAFNGDAGTTGVITPGSLQSVTLSYSNTLPTTVTNASVIVSIAGSAIDYASIKTTDGFYNSANHTILFSKDTDPALASLAPGASGIGTFTFMSLPVGTSAPTITLALSVSGTRVGQSNVPEQVMTSIVKTVKVATIVLFSASSSHTSDSFGASGPIPPRANQPTTYVVAWNAQNKGSAIAGGTVTTLLPSYVSYTDKTSGTGTFSYDSISRTVTWNVGDLSQGANARGTFQVMFTPSTSQRGGAVSLTGGTSFSGYDRFAGVQVSAVADPVTTETPGDLGYVPANALVQ